MKDREDNISENSIIKARNIKAADFLLRIKTAFRQDKEYLDDLSIERNQRFIKDILDWYKKRIELIFLEILYLEALSNVQKQLVARHLFKEQLKRISSLVKITDVECKYDLKITTKSLIDFILKIDFGEYLSNDFIKKELENEIISIRDFNKEIFVSIYAQLLFEEYSKNYFVDLFTDTAFIFQSMKNDKLVQKMEHKDFANFLFSEGLIKQKDLDKITDNRGFKALSKCSSDSRLNNYLNLKEKYIEV